MPGELFGRAAALVVLVAAVGACDSQVMDSPTWRILEAVSHLGSAGAVASIAPTEPVAVPTVAFVATAAAGPAARVESAGEDRQIAPAGATQWNRSASSMHFNNPVPGAAVTFTVLKGGGALSVTRS